MTVKAPISTGWRVRLGGMAAMFVGFCAYFLYDGFVGYPGQEQIYQQFAAFKEKNKEVETLKLHQMWDEHAATKGLPTIGNEREPLHKYHHSESDILWQKIYGFGLIPVAVMMVFSWTQTFSRWVAADEQGVTASTGQVAPWASMTKLDKTRWPKKGIAFLSYQDGEKQIEQKILLDDFKFDRPATEQIVRAIEDHLKDEQIIGDIREVERDKRRAEKAAAASAKATETTPAANPQA